MVDRRSAAAASCVILLIAGLQEMHVQRRAMLLGTVAHALECPVRTPVEIGRSELDAHTVVARVLAFERLEQQEIVLERESAHADELRDVGCEIGRKSPE